MATALAAKQRIKDIVFEWEGKDRNGKLVRGELRAGGEAAVSASLRRQGVLVTKVKKRRMSGGKSISAKDVAVFTRQLATMMKAGVPLLQAFDIVGRGSTNPRMTRLLNEIRGELESAGRPVGYAEMLASAAAADPLKSLFDPNDPALLGFANVPSTIRDLCARSRQVVPVDTGAIVRASLESLALSFRQTIEALETATDRRIDTVRLVGGGSRNELLCQWTADASGRQVAAGPAEASGMGNIIVQSVATGLAGSIVEARTMVAESSSVRWYEPHPGDLWEAAYERFGVICDRQDPTG